MPPKCIVTYTGKSINPAKLQITDIDPIDICHSLALTNRYNGHSLFPFSVAQHSVLLWQSIKKDRDASPYAVTWALLHDAVESYIGDIPSPIKPTFSIGDETFQGLEDRLQLVIQERFNLKSLLTEDDLNLVEEYDKRIICNEYPVLMSYPLITSLQKLPEVEIKEWKWHRAKHEMLNAFKQEGLIK